MESLLRKLEPTSAAAAALLAGSVWKSLLLVACVAVLLRCVPRLSATVRSVIWTAVLLFTMLLPVISLFAAGSGEGTRSVFHAGADWSLAIAGVWAAMSLLRLLQLGASAFRLRAIARRAIPAPVSGAVEALLGESTRRVTLCTSVDVSRPSVAGFFQPRILLPAGLLEELSEAELQHVVLHEMEHLRRRDDWTNLLQKLSLALFPLHPALLWLDRRMCLEWELACDDGVLRVTHAPKAYAACLARLAEDSLVRRGFSLGLSLAMGLLGVGKRDSELSGRVHRILRSPAAAMGQMQARLAGGAVLAGVLAGSLLLARSPQLISFSAGVPAVAEARSLGSLEAPPAGVPRMGLPVSARVQGFGTREMLVKAVMPQARTQLLPAAVARRKQAARRVNVSAARKAVPSAPYVVFTEWHATIEQPRLTLAVARYPQDLQDSQPTYAAVPVRGGWLLIKL